VAGASYQNLNVAGKKQRQPVTLHRALLTALAAVLFALGWVAGKIALALSWTGAAIKLGWTDARKRRVRKT
jgi:uncharacterized membrane protein YciS (DUF1049 family)